MDSQGMLHESVKVEHASGPDPYELHPEAFGNPELGKWDPDLQDGRAGLGVNQTES
jgi:hypothetical protein